jgi:transcriptional regulator with XRE-family HTH domain
MLNSTAGDTLRHARWAKGWTIQQLAEKAGVSLNLIVKLESGKRNVLGQKVYAVADALDIDAGSLFDTEEVAS